MQVFHRHTYDVSSTAPDAELEGGEMGSAEDGGRGY